MQKRCIYHVPYPIKAESNAGSAIRPRKMLEALQRNFDDVFVISGYGKERKQKYHELKQNIKKGIKYEFMYSENSTMPNLLTEENHVPCYPFLEKNIFRLCKKNHIPIGLFYRDVYWKFPVYKEGVSWYKRLISVPLYEYDLAIYNKYVDILYLPSDEMSKYVPFNGKKKPLPPAIDGTKVFCKSVVSAEDKLELFYVGGIGGDYNIIKLVECMKKCLFANLTLCCHKDQWEKWIGNYEDNISDNITVVHEQGEKLEEYYKKANLSLLFFQPEGYRKMAMPIKLFEYLEHATPIIATVGCAAGDFVENNNIGWSIDYTEERFVDLLSELNTNRDLIDKLSSNMTNVSKNHTWDARVIEVYTDLHI